MWFDFFFSAVVAAVVLLLPGGLMVYSLRRSIIEAAGFGPIVSVACYSVFSIVYSVMGLSCSGLSLFAPFLAISIVLSIVAFRTFNRNCAGFRLRDELPYIVLYGLIGIFIVGFFFVKNLDGAGSFCQAFDNGFHLSTIRTFIDSGVFSSFATGYGEGISDPFDSGPSFYPAAWHCLVSMVATFSTSSITVAVNAVNFVLSAIVFPLSMLFLLDRLFDGSKKLLLGGAFLTVAAAPFPWGYLTFGPLYPNLLSMAMFPAALVVSLRFVDFNISAISRLRWFAAVVVATIALMFAQPNSIFAELILVAPFFVSECYFASLRNANRTREKTSIVLACSIVFVCVIWVILYSLPISMIRSTVDFNWPATVGRWQAIMDCFLFSFNTGAAQPAIAILVLMGCVRAVSTRKNVWLVASYLLACVIYISSVSTDGLLKHVLSGFWYTDPFRLAATASVIAIPLATIGAEWLLALVSYFIGWIGKESNLFIGEKTGLVSLALVLCVCLYSPSFAFAGLGDIVTGFGCIAKKVEAQNNEYSDKVLDHDEIEFAERALGQIPKNELVLNEPNDGSEFLYALFDANNLYYKRFDLPSSGESSNSILIRQSIDKVASDGEVKEAVRETGAKYVLLLDQGGDPAKRVHFWSYYPEQWQGFGRITDSTPGFEVVMAEGDMRLYKITA